MLRSELVVHKLHILTTRLEINETQLDDCSVGLMVLYCAALGDLLAQVTSQGRGSRILRKGSASQER